MRLFKLALLLLLLTACSQRDEKQTDEQISRQLNEMIAQHEEFEKKRGFRFESRHPDCWNFVFSKTNPCDNMECLKPRFVKYLECEKSRPLSLEDCDNVKDRSKLCGTADCDYHYSKEHLEGLAKCKEAYVSKSSSPTAQAQ